MTTKTPSPLMCDIKVFSRRDFFKGAGALAGLSVAGCGTVPARRTAFGPGDKLRHAAIGVGGMGFNDLKNFLSHPRVEVVAICDVDADRLAKAAELAPKARRYVDWREMLDKEPENILKHHLATKKGTKQLHNKKENNTNYKYFHDICCKIQYRSVNQKSIAENSGINCEYNKH